MICILITVVSMRDRQCLDYSESSKNGANLNSCFWICCINHLQIHIIYAEPKTIIQEEL